MRTENIGIVGLADEMTITVALVGISTVKILTRLIITEPAETDALVLVLLKMTDTTA